MNGYKKSNSTRRLHWRSRKRSAGTFLRERRSTLTEDQDYLRNLMGTDGSIKVVHWGTLAA